MEQKDLLDLLQKGYILYQKHDKLEAEKAPQFGSVKLNYQDGKFVTLEKIETKK